MWRASILTIFPEMFPGPLSASLAGKALAARLWTLDAVDIPAPAPRDEPARGSTHPSPSRSAGQRVRRRDPLRPLRGHRRAPDRRARLRGGLDRRLRAFGWGDRGLRPARRLRAPTAWRDGQGGLGPGGELQPGPARIPAIHQAAGVGGPFDPP